MAAPASNKIALSFGWMGSSCWNGGISHGGLEVGVIDLLFQNASTEVSVTIPQDTNCSKVKRFPFTCRKYSQIPMTIDGRTFRPLAQETTPNVVSVTIEKMRNLTIRAGIFEESPHSSYVMDTSGRVTKPLSLLRSNREIHFKLKEELESDQHYTLVIESADKALTARLVKVRAAS